MAFGDKKHMDCIEKLVVEMEVEEFIDEGQKNKICSECGMDIGISEHDICFDCLQWSRDDDYWVND